MCKVMLQQLRLSLLELSSVSSWLALAVAVEEETGVPKGLGQKARQFGRAMLMWLKGLWLIQ